MNVEFDYSRCYCIWHTDTPEHIQEMKVFYQNKLLKFFPPNKDIKILDIGCGMGFTLLALKEMGYLNNEGIDVDDKQIQSCIKKQLNVTQTEDSIAYLTARPDTYDIIIAFDVIEHIPYKLQLDFSRAIQRAIKPGGKLICTVPNANSVIADRWRFNDWTHHISFTEHSIDFLLFNSGFDKIEIFETEFFQKPKLRGLLSLSIFKPWLWKSYLHWVLFCLVRVHRRLEMIAELGWDQGCAVPLSLNLLATAVKPLGKK